MAGNLEPIPQQTIQPAQNNNIAEQQPQISNDLNPQPQNNFTSEQQIPVKCIRQGCPNPAVTNPEWEDEYCSNECVVTHCGNVFSAWVAANSQDSSVSNAL